MTMKAGIALGSNLEPRLLNLQGARRRIFALHTSAEPIASSKVYETSPVDCPEGSAPFLNAVMEITSSLDPEELLQRLQAIEQELGRPAEHSRNAPRTIDLDLLYCGDLVRDEPAFTLPHPRIAQRLFVLRPLCDIRPDLVLPGSNLTVRNLLAALDSGESVTEFCGALY
jgi:2-amino-4-hydroxy-6-hydroxymethyldihydropteridine diphosphokinase